VIDFQAHNLHLVSYSEPVAQTVSLSDLDGRLHSLPEQPAWIPYRTSYYKRSWGFCLPHAARQALQPGQYRVEIRSSLAPGALTYGEIAIPGQSRDEVLFFTHICHPSLANDNAAGMAVASALGTWIASKPRRYSYRLVFAPGTIGSLCWLKQNEQRLARVRAGLVLGLLGDPGGLTYKMSRNGSTETDAIASYVLSQTDAQGAVIPFSPYGYDERQLCSPGFDLPVGRLTRSVNGGYAQYHTSADDLSLIKPEFLEQSLAACQLFVEVLEDNRHYVNLSPKGEPRLGKRGLYGATGGMSPAEREHAMLWVLNQTDGTKSTLDIARRSGLAFKLLRDASAQLEQAGLLRSLGRQARPGKPATSARTPKQKATSKTKRSATTRRRRTTNTQPKGARK
jgi:aminopeptidase-like protein